MQYETGRTGYDTGAPKDTDNDFLCAVQLQRIANSLETIIKMVKKDQEAADAYRRQQNDQKD